MTTPETSSVESLNGIALLQHAKEVLDEVQRLHQEYKAKRSDRGALTGGENEEAFRQAMLVFDTLSKDPTQDMNEVRTLIEQLRACMDMWNHKHASVGEWYPHLNDMLANASRTRLSSVLGTPVHYDPV